MGTRHTIASISEPSNIRDVLTQPEHYGYKATGALGCFIEEDLTGRRHLSVAELADVCARELERPTVEISGGRFDHYRQPNAAARQEIASDLRRRVAPAA